MQYLGGGPWIGVISSHHPRPPRQQQPLLPIRHLRQGLRVHHPQGSARGGQACRQVAAPRKLCARRLVWRAACHVLPEHVKLSRLARWLPLEQRQQAYIGVYGCICNGGRNSPTLPRTFWCGMLGRQASTGEVSLRPQPFSTGRPMDCKQSSAAQCGRRKQRLEAQAGRHTQPGRKPGA